MTEAVATTEKKKSLSAQFRKAMPVTHFVTKWGSIATGAASGLTGLIVGAAMTSGGAGVAIAGGLTTMAFMGLAIGLQVLLPAVIMFAAGEALIRYGISKNTENTTAKDTTPKAETPAAAPAAKPAA